LGSRARHQSPKTSSSLSRRSGAVNCLHILQRPERQVGVARQRWRQGRRTAISHPSSNRPLVQFLPNARLLPSKTTKYNILRPSRSRPIYGRRSLRLSSNLPRIQFLPNARLFHSKTTKYNILRPSRSRPIYGLRSRQLASKTLCPRLTGRVLDQARAALSRYPYEVHGPSLHRSR
jgi:hypothetical protein